MCRGVTRLDGAWGKKQVWCPHVRTWGLSEANVLFWKKCFWHLCDFLAPTVIRPPGNWALLHPSWHLWGYTTKIGKMSENKQTSNVMNFYSMSICNFRTQCHMDLTKTANKSYWRHFKFLREVFVSLRILPHAFLRYEPVFVLLLMKLFRHSTSYFFRLR